MCLQRGRGGGIPAEGNNRRTSAIRPVLPGAHLASWDEPAAATCPTRVNKVRRAPLQAGDGGQTERPRTVTVLGAHETQTGVPRPRAFRVLGVTPSSTCVGATSGAWQWEHVPEVSDTAADAHCSLGGPRPRPQRQLPPDTGRPAGLPSRAVCARTREWESRSDSLPRSLQARRPHDRAPRAAPAERPPRGVGWGWRHVRRDLDSRALSPAGRAARRFPGSREGFTRRLLCRLPVSLPCPRSPVSAASSSGAAMFHPCLSTPFRVVFLW